jgi:hypothetical protein
MTNVIEVSYTGDLLAHRRCPRAWAYEKYAGFHPYEQVQAMEGCLIHHAMEWLTAFFAREKRHASRAELENQPNALFSCPLGSRHPHCVYEQEGYDWPRP